MAQTFISGGKNPYLPLSIYIPDGEPKLFDGRVYLYDRSNDGKKSDRHLSRGFTC